MQCPTLAGQIFLLALPCSPVLTFYPVLQPVAPVFSGLTVHFGAVSWPIPEAANVSGGEVAYGATFLLLQVEL
jgi:hypothetical protein